MIEGNYKNGLKNGLWIYYNDKNEIDKKQIYNNGALIKEEKIKSEKSE